MSKELVVYWSPYQGFEGTNTNFNLLYKQPELLKHTLTVNQNNKQRNFFRCPGFINAIDNVYVIENPIRSELKIDGDTVYALSQHYMNGKVVGGPSIEGCQVFEYAVQNIFFCEEDLNMLVTAPWFSGNAQHLKYGQLVPGRFNIGQWFRPFNIEVQLNKNINTILFEEGEHLAYINFLTDKKIKIKRFEFNQDLYRLSLGCSTSMQWEERIPLAKRYKRFMETKTNKLVIKHIKQNLID